MPGALHLLFGAILGILLWKIGENRYTKDKHIDYRWNFPIVLVFIINNHFGPDLGGAIHKIGKALEIFEIYQFGSFVHSLFGWIIIAPLYAFLMNKIAKWMEKSHQNSKKNKNDPNNFSTSETTYHHSYSMYMIATIMGGTFHFFMDGIGHYDIIDGMNFMRGKFPLFGGLVFTNLVIIVTLYLIVLGVWVYQMKKSDEILKYNLYNHLKLKGNLICLFFIVLSLANVLFMYNFLIQEDLILESQKTFTWTDKIDYQSYFMIGNSMHIGVLDLEGSATWWYAIWLILLIVGCIISYIKSIEITIGKRKIRGEVLIIVLFCLGIVFGYFIQPIIGNISGEEYDWGAFVFMWPMFLTPLWGLACIQREENK